MATQLNGGVVHKLPADLKKALSAKPKASDAWESLTSLSRNEWICWVESVKREETRLNHVKRTVSELIEGKRRPCCWIGCVHRTDKSMSKSQKWVLSKRKE